MPSSCGVARRGRSPSRATSAATARSISAISRRPTRAAISIFSRAPRRRRSRRFTDVRIVAAPKLVELVTAIMHAAGCNAVEAGTIARRLVDSNLVGHDSHGVLRVGKYLEWMREGWVKANQNPTIVFDSDVIAIVDGNRGFGQVVGEFAGKIGITKAAKAGIALVGLRNCGHLGRVGDWAELAAEANQVSLHFLNTSGAQRVAPFGGSDRRLSTNPITIGVPIAGGGPVILDGTTSMLAEGTVFVASNQ